MPLLRRQPFAKQKPPEDLRLNEEVFHCSLTNEIFRDYEKFFERVILCNSLVWTCEISGRPGLTYQEALDSESRARKQLASFPEHLQIVVLYLASLTHRSRLNDINDDVFVFMKDRFFVGETVEVVEGSSRKMCKVMKVIQPDEAEEGTSEDSDDVICLDDPNPKKKSPTKRNKTKCSGTNKSSESAADLQLYQYVVQELKKPNIYIVLGSQMSRKKGLFTRDKCKLFLKQHCDSQLAGIWKVKKRYFSKFKLGTVAFEEFFDGSPPTFGISQMKKKPSKMSNPVIDLTEDLMQSQTKHEKLAPQRAKAIAAEREKLRLDRIMKKEEMKRMWEEEKLRRKEEKAKEREQKRVEKIERDAYLKEWSRSRDDMECDDLKDLPVPSPIDSHIPSKLFGECLMVLEYFHCFNALLEVKKTFPSGVSHAEFCKALQETSVDNLFADVLHFLLKSIFNLQEQEEEEEDWDGPDANSRRVPDEYQSDASFEKLVRQATADSQLPQQNYGSALRQLHLDNFTLTEVLRLHLLASGARSTNVRFHYQQRGAYTPYDDAGLEFRRSQQHIMRSCAERSIFDLNAGDKLKIVNALVQQLLTFVPCRDLVEESFEKLKAARNDLRQYQFAEQKRGRDEANFWYRKKLAERQRELGNQETNTEGAKSEDAVVLQKLDLSERKSERGKPASGDLPTENIDWDMSAAARAALRQRGVERERQLAATIKRVQRGHAMCPLGRDRAHRRYWLFDSLAGLYVEDDDPFVPPESLRPVAQTAAPEGSSDKENDSFETAPHGAGEDKLLAVRSVSVGELVAHSGAVPWAFFHTEAQLDRLVVALNPRGLREGPLRVALLEQRERVSRSMAACPVSTLDSAVATAKARARGGSPGGATAQEALEWNLREMLLDVEEKIYVGSLGSLKVHDRLCWRVALEEGRYDSQCEEFTSQTKNAKRFDAPAAVLENGVDKESDEVTITSHMVVSDLSKALIQIQRCVEQRYLKQPLGTAEEVQRKHKKKSTRDDEPACLLDHWEQCVLASTSLSQLFLHLSVLEKSVMWVRSALNARCRICRRKGDGEHMLLCDGCDRGHHMYCLKPPVTKIPHGDWYCPYCRPKEVVRTPRKNRKTFTEETDEEEEVEEEISQSEDEAVDSIEDETTVDEEDAEENLDDDLEEDEEEVTDDDDLSEDNNDSVECEMMSSDEEEEEEVEPAPAKIKFVKKKWREPSSGRSTPSVVDSDSGRPNRSSRTNRSLDTAVKSRSSRGVETAPKSRHSLEPAGGKGAGGRGANRPGTRHSVETEKPAKQAKQAKQAKGATLKRAAAVKRKLNDDVTDAKQSKQMTTKSRSSEAQCVMRQCEALIQEMAERSEAWPFLTPVTKRDAPDYFDVIREPMDFSRIRIKINKFEYTSPAQLLRDVRLIFTNCQQYNMPMTPEFIAAQKLSRFFEKRLRDAKLHIWLAGEKATAAATTAATRKGRNNAR